MKINIIPLICSVLLAGLASWAFHAAGFTPAVTLAGGFTLLLSLSVAMGVELKSGRKNVNMKVTAWIAVIAFAVLNLLSGLLGCGTAFVIVSNAFLLILILLIMERMHNAKM